MKIPNINCKYYDFNAGGKCDKLPKRLWIFKKLCILISNKKICKFQDKWKRPEGMPPPPPMRIYKDSFGLLIRDKQNLRDCYEWNIRIQLKE